MEEKGDAKNCDQITLDEETTNERHQNLKTKVENLFSSNGKTLQDINAYKLKTHKARILDLMNNHTAKFSF